MDGGIKIIQGYRFSTPEIILGECLPMGITWWINKGDGIIREEEQFHYRVISGTNAQFMPLFGDLLKQKFLLYGQEFLIPRNYTIEYYAPIVEGAYQAKQTITRKKNSILEDYNKLTNDLNLSLNGEVHKLYKSICSKEKKTLIDITKKILDIDDWKHNTYVILELVTQNILLSRDPIRALECLSKMPLKNNYNSFFDLYQEIYYYLKDKNLGVSLPTNHMQVERCLILLYTVLDNSYHFPTNIVREILTGSICILAHSLGFVFEFEYNLDEIFTFYNDLPIIYIAIFGNLTHDRIYKDNVLHCDCEVIFILEEFLNSIYSAGKNKILMYSNDYYDFDYIMIDFCNALEKFFTDVIKIQNNIKLLDSNCEYCKLMFKRMEKHELSLPKNWENEFSIIKKACDGYGEWLITEFNKRKQLALTKIEKLKIK